MAEKDVFHYATPPFEYLDGSNAKKIINEKTIYFFNNVFV